MIGLPCDSDADCGDPVATCLTPDQDFPNGYCTYTQEAVGSCPEGSRMAWAPTLEAVTCREECETDGDCRDADYACYDFFSPVRTDLICSPVARGSTPFGGSCSRLDQCSGGKYAFCNEQGMCSERCTSWAISGGEELGDCPAGTACGFTSSECRQICEEDSDCPSGFFCFPDFLGGDWTCEPETD